LSPNAQTRRGDSDAAIGEGALAVIQLINAPRLRLGALAIDPPQRRIVHDDGREETLEPRVMQVLVAFARAPGTILSRDDLIASCWEGRFVGDDAVNRVMSRLRRLSQEIGAGSFHLQTITKVGFRLVVETPDSASTPIDLIAPTEPIVGDELAPPDELRSPEASSRVPATTENLPPPAELGTEPRRVRLGRNRRLIAILGAVAGVILLGLVGAILVWRSAPEARSAPALQLATFDNLSPAGAPGAEQALREELVAAFGRSASLQLFTDGAKAPPGPSTFRLGGSVEPLGPTLRFAFTLSRGAPGAIVWSSVIQRPIAQASTAPQQVAAQISFTVRCVLNAAAGYPGELPQAALSDYAKFCAEVGSSESGEAVSRMTEDLREAVAQAPNFAAGWAQLGYVIGDKFAYPAALWDAGSRTEAEEAVDHALRLDPTSSTGHLAKALLTPWPNYAGREDELRLAVRGGDTFGDAHAAYSRFLLGVGRVKEAAFMAEHGYDLDPTDREVINRLIESFYILGHTPEADALVTRAKGLWADSPKLTLYELWAATWDGQHQAALETLSTGRYDEAIRSVGPDAGSTAPIADAGAKVFRALDSANATERAAAADAMARLVADPRSIDPFVPVALAALGRDREALAADERVVREWSTSLTVLLFTPPFANARRSPQFAALADRLGLLSYWRKPGRAPDFCTDRNPPPLCRQLR